MIGYALRSSENPKTRTNHAKEFYIRKLIFSGECNHKKYIPEHPFRGKFYSKYILHYVTHVTYITS